jgi:hypothetical protein
MFQRIGDRKKPGLVTIFERHWIVIRKNKGSVSQRLLFFLEFDVVKNLL